jgi:hypothetical protein
MIYRLQKGFGTYSDLFQTYKSQLRVVIVLSPFCILQSTIIVGTVTYMEEERLYIYKSLLFNTVNLI